MAEARPTRPARWLPSGKLGLPLLGCLGQRPVRLLPVLGDRVPAFGHEVCSDTVAIQQCLQRILSVLGVPTGDGVEKQGVRTVAANPDRRRGLLNDLEAGDGLDTRPVPAWIAQSRCDSPLILVHGAAAKVPHTATLVATRSLDVSPRG